MKKILELIGMWIIGTASAVAFWYYGNLYGNVYAAIIVLGILYTVVANIGKRGEAPGEVVLIAVAFIPLMIIVAVSMVFSGNETFRMIESGSIVALLIVIMVTVTPEVIDEVKREAKRSREAEELKIRLEEEKKLYKFEENIIKKEVNIDLIKLYKESSEVKNRVVGTVLMEENFSIDYIYLIDNRILKMVIQENNNYYEYKINEEIVEKGEVSASLITRIIKEFIQEELGMKYKPLKKHHSKGMAYSNFWLLNSNSWVRKDELYYNENTVDEIVISKDKKSGEYGVIFVDRFFTPAGLSFPISGDNISDRPVNRIEKIESNIENLKTVLGDRFEAKKLKEIGERYQGFELRGSINSKITIWYNEDKDKRYNFFDSDRLSYIFIPMKNLKELIEDKYDEVEGLRLISHQKEILKMLIEASKTDINLNEYFKEA